MAFNKKGRFYEKGKCLSEELKGQIVDKILETDLSILLTSIFPSHITFLFCWMPRAPTNFTRITWQLFCHVTTSFGHHVISFLQPTVQNSNGGFTTLVILVVWLINRQNWGKWSLFWDFISPCLSTAAPKTWTKSLGKETLLSISENKSGRWKTIFGQKRNWFFKLAQLKKK